MEVKIKKLHKDAIIPTYAKDGDAGMDLIAINRDYILINENLPDYIEYKTGLSIEIPFGYVGLIFPRSSNSKVDLYLSNSVGVIDSGYRGEISFRYKLDTSYNSVVSQDKDEFYLTDCQGEKFCKVYSIGDKIGQLIIIPYPQIEFKEVDELSETYRGIGGFGSTGK